MSDADNTTEQPQDQGVDHVEAEAQAPDEDVLGDAGKRALTAERDARKAAERRSAEFEARLKEIEDANLSELQKAQRDAEALRTELEQERRASLINRVALDKGVPTDLIQFLSGDTEDDIAAKADVLMSRMNAPTTPRPDYTQGASGKAPKLSNADMFAQQMADILI